LPMAFVKVTKQKSYFKRYQVKYRRRRCGKTDYRARHRLVIQDKNKYQSPRYRLVARLTNHYVIAQIVYAEIEGDRVLCSAYSSELKRYGIGVGLKNYAAAYATGLLVARRTLAKLNLDKDYKGVKEVDGKIAHSSDDKRDYWVDAVVEGKRPFRAVLDVGTRPTTTGARVFAILKGASDGGIDVPHNEKRFPGYNRESKEYDAGFHRDRIFGKHLGDYKAQLQEEDPEAYSKRFSQFEAAKISPEDLPDLYKKVHAAIRKDASPGKKSSYKVDKKFAKPGKVTGEQRAEGVRAKKGEHAKELQARIAAGRSAAAEEADDEDM